MRLRFRLSLLGRMAVSLLILLSMTLVLAVFLGGIGGILGISLLGGLHSVVEALSGLPRLSRIAPLSPTALAAAAFLAILAVIRGWPYVRASSDVEQLLPPRSLPTVAVTVGLVGCLYLLVVEASAAILAVLSTTAGGVAVVLVGVGVAVWMTVSEVRKRIETLRTELLADSHALEHTRPEVVDAVRRLAHLVDVPEPSVYVTDTARPESITIGTGEDAVILLSSGLLETLPEEELKAVLAHEVSHLANGDSRVMGAALGPVLAADEWIDDPDDPGDWVWNALFGLLKRYAQFGVAILSRGRERSADIAAAELTGSPAALASALARLDDARNVPETDLREWERSAAVMDILPPAESDVSTGPFRTHPPTEKRIEYLEELTTSAESEA